MSVPQREPVHTDFTTLACRRAVEHRATWMGLIYAEAKKHAAEAEDICRKAILQCGLIHGEGYKADCSDPDSAASFGKALFHEQTTKTMEVNTVEADNDHLIVEFYHCPLVCAWEKLGFSGAELELLCDIAMDGDRGIAEAMGLSLDLQNTIAQGHEKCRLHFYK